MSICRMVPVQMLKLCLHNMLVSPVCIQGEVTLAMILHKEEGNRRRWAKERPDAAEQNLLGL